MKRRSRLQPILFAALTLTLLCGAYPVETDVTISSHPLLNSPQLPIDPGSYYRLTTLWQGDCRSLDIINDGTNTQPILAKTDDVSGQYWKMTPAGGGFYRLTTKWQGEGKSLDIVNDGRNNRPILATTADVLGQYWRIVSAGNGYFRLQNRWQAAGKSLDIVNDGNNNRPILAPTTNASGQSWKISLARFVSAPPASLRLRSFYKQYLDANGIPIISSDKVPPAALYRVQFITLHMLSRIPRVTDEMVRRGARIAIMAKTEVTTDIPEHAFLARDTTTNWNTRARGLGGTIDVPTSSCAEENVLCYSTDSYRGEDIFLHEFAHSIHKLGLVYVYPDFQRELDAAFSNATRNRLWTNTYAITNADEYFAEGVQNWFNVNLQANPSNGIHNSVNTRAELRSYDARLHDLIKKYFPEDENKCSCQ